LAVSFDIVEFKKVLGSWSSLEIILKPGIMIGVRELADEPMRTRVEFVCSFDQCTL
jgi:hypothetical protein